MHVEFESRKSLAHDTSWNQPSFAIFNLISHMTDLPVVLGLSDVITQSEQLFCHKLCSNLLSIVPEY